MPHRVLHLSDTHVSRTGPDEDGVDGLGALKGLLCDVRRIPELDLIVVSGDIADDGSEEGCLAVRSAVGEFAAERGIPHVYCTGNHDHRDGFTAALGWGHLGPDGASIGRRADVAGGIAAVSEVDGLRVITLDSLVPGETHGVLGQDQLDWLAGELGTPAPAGTIVVLHHPPISVDALPYLKSVVLQEPEKLERVLTGTDVQAVLCGHLHHQLAGRLGDKPVSVTPGVVTRIDLTAPSHLVRGVLGAGATIVDLGGPFAPMFHTLQARAPKPAPRSTSTTPSAARTRPRTPEVIQYARVSQLEVRHGGVAHSEAVSARAVRRAAIAGGSGGSPYVAA